MRRKNENANSSRSLWKLNKLQCESTKTKHVLLITCEREIKWVTDLEYIFHGHGYQIFLLQFWQCLCSVATSARVLVNSSSSTQDGVIKMQQFSTPWEGILLTGNEKIKMRIQLYIRLVHSVTVSNIVIKSHSSQAFRMSTNELSSSSGSQDLRQSLVSRRGLVLRNFNILLTAETGVQDFAIASRKMLIVCSLTEISTQI